MSKDFDLLSMLLAIGYVATCNDEQQREKLKVPETYRQEVEDAYSCFRQLEKRIPPSI